MIKKVIYKYNTVLGNTELLNSVLLTPPVDISLNRNNTFLTFYLNITYNEDVETDYSYIRDTIELVLAEFSEPEISIEDLPSLTAQTLYAINYINNSTSDKKDSSDYTSTNIDFTPDTKHLSVKQILESNNVIYTRLELLQHTSSLERFNKLIYKDGLPDAISCDSIILYISIEGIVFSEDLIGKCPSLTEYLTALKVINPHASYKTKGFIPPIFRELVEEMLSTLNEQCNGNPLHLEDESQYYRSMP